jgi:hypothetical protein
MAMTLTQLTGTIDLPNGETPSHGRIRFEFSQFGVNGGNIFVPGPVEFQLSETGALVDCRVQSTVLLDGLVLATPTVIYWSTHSGREVRFSLPQISVPASGPVDLANLLAIPAPIPSVPDALAQALAFAASAESDAAAAAAILVQTEAARDAALAAQAEIESGLSLGVEQTWQDVSSARVQGTAYQNTTGRAICVYAEVSSGYELSMKLRVSPTLPLPDNFNHGGSPDVVEKSAYIYVNLGDYSYMEGTLWVETIVPPGHYYGTSYGSPHTKWLELR